MNLLLALLLYKNLTLGDILNLRPFLPTSTQRGLSALEAYNNADCTSEKKDVAELAERLSHKGFPFVLLRLLSMKEPSQGDIFALLRHMLPADIANSIPDPETIMNMMNIMSAMSFTDDDPAQEEDHQRASDSPNQDKKSEDCKFNEKQTSFFKKFIKDE